jgi:hypothetical protein
MLLVSGSSVAVLGAEIREVKAATETRTDGGGYSSKARSFSLDESLGFRVGFG